MTKKMNKRQIKKKFKRAEKKRKNGLLAVYVKCTCGCCTEELLFKDRASAALAFNKAGLDCSATIVDDAGVEHKELDTFYGYTFQKEEVEKRSLKYLL